MNWLIVAGRLATGKTTLAYALARTGQASVVTVSEVLREQMRARGTPAPTRLDLQEFGAQMLVNGPSVLGGLLLTAAGGAQHVVVDGLRARNVADWLALQLPAGSLRIAFLEAPDEIRRSRYASRRSVAPFVEADSHPVEGLVDEFRLIADGVIDASLPPAQVVAQVEALLFR